MLQIVLSPNPILLQKSENCDLADPSIKKLAKDMQEVMYHFTGVGLAGPQVGQLKRIIVMDIDYDPDKIKETKNPIVLINPEYLEKSEEMEDSDEGCLSCPGISAPVLRHKYVKVKYFDLSGKEQIIEGEGLLSHCLQHEMDHLEGKTVFQTSKPEARLQLLKDYEEALAQGVTPGQVTIPNIASENE